MRILLAPLDWGLGHATRCMPLIDPLQEQGAEVILGCAGRAGALLRREYPDLPYVDLPAYRIRYGNPSLVMSMAAQLPRMLVTLRREHLVLGELVRRHHIHGVISDNRYGLYHRKVSTVLITHQLHPRIPVPLVDPIVQAVLGHWIRRYDACWIPDHAGDDSLAGALAHPPRHPQTTFLGPLSRFEAVGAGPSFRYDILCLLSGPEPQRSYLERILRPQLIDSGLRGLMVLGKPESDVSERQGNLEVRSHLLAGPLQRAMRESRLVLCRPGYSTLMDLQALGKRAVLIPTPGQTEQEYLARRLHVRGTCYSQAQAGFSLSTALSAAADFAGFSPPGPGSRDQLGAVLGGWLKEVADTIN